MNYEEKYKALVNAIKVLQETNPSDVGIRNWVNDNVPELRESEDEKVRKELLRHCIKAANGETIIVSTDDYYRWSRWLEKQGEQKPVEWEQENVGELSDFENVMMHIGRSFFGENADLDPNDTATIKEQAELLLEAAPKTEWSEEDEKIIHNIRVFIEKYAISQSAVDVNGELCDKTYIDADNWLKALKQRHTWKPSSELDEASYQVGIKRVLENPESYGLTKYNWKPSNDQLYILNWLANVKLGDSVVEQEVSKHLNELYKDLKKLREE